MRILRRHAIKLTLRSNRSPYGSDEPYLLTMRTDLRARRAARASSYRFEPDGRGGAMLVRMNPRGAAGGMRVAGTMRNTREAQSRFAAKHL